jgi:hypothetical protein
MKRLAMVLMSGVFTAAALRCAAEPVCTRVAVEGRVEAAGPGELTLADLLARGTCPQLRQVAARVSLGSVPRAGSVRVLDGRQVRRLLETLAGDGLSVRKTISMQIPERIAVRRAGAAKSCREIARFVASAAPSQDRASAPSRGQEDLNCGAARSVPEDTALELTKSTWNAALQRREFALRCARPEDCVPFLVWGREEKTRLARDGDAQRGAVQRLASAVESSPAGLAQASKAGGSGIGRMVKPGQTATLTWEQAGIRIVLPVTCLDGGGLGQFVRVQFKNAARILRAQVVGDGTLRASL